MALRYNGTTIGKMTVAQDFGGRREKFNLQIRQANCLAVILYVRKSTDEELARNPKGKWYHELVSFFVDEKHMRGLIKDYGEVLDPINKVLSCELNMYYKECWTLLKYFTRSGYKVRCYYKEPKKK